MTSPIPVHTEHHLATRVQAANTRYTHTLLAGTNNAFQVNNLTSLALLYNDVSVLENHHVATLFRIVNDPTVNADIFARLSKEQFREVRAVIIKSVLGTDMRYHFESTNLFKARYHRDLAPLTMCRVRGRSPAARTTERVRTATRRTEPARVLDQVPTTVVVPFYWAGEIARARENSPPAPFPHSRRCEGRSSADHEDPAAHGRHQQPGQALVRNRSTCSAGLPPTR